MDYKKIKAPTDAIAHDLKELEDKTGNIYQTVVILSKRANQIAAELKDELYRKLQEFEPYPDNLEEIFQNKDQIELSRKYERLPKPTNIALQEYLEDRLQWRYPNEDEQN